MPPVDSNTTVGAYQIIRPLGSGGMGSVFLATDPRLDRLVAIKMLRDQEHDDFARQRFTREARSVARLDHPNVIRIYEYGLHGAQPFIAMEYIEGATLAARLRYGTRTIGDVLNWVEQLCEGLAHAHASSVIHRDVKPANVIISKGGVVKVVDFGIARFGGTSVTETGAVIGTLNYMSPEQLEGRGVDHRTDVFSTGLVLYELLTGCQAFPGGLHEGLLAAILKGEPAPIARFYPTVSVDVVALVAKALAKSPARRFQSMGEMVSELRKARSSLQDIDELVVSGNDETMAAAPLGPSAAGHRSSTSQALHRATTLVIRHPKKAVASIGALGLVALSMTPAFRREISSAAPQPPRVSTPTPSAAPPPAVPAAKAASGEKAGMPTTVVTAPIDKGSSNAAPGELIVDATPWATIVRITNESGEVVARATNATTPARLSVPEGAYSITLRDQYGNRQTVRARVRGGERAEVAARFKSISAADYLNKLSR